MKVLAVVSTLWLATIAFSIVGTTFQASQLRGVREDLEATRIALNEARDLLSRSEAARTIELEQCNRDLAGEIQRGKDEVKRAGDAATARAALTTACAHDKGKPSVNRALRDVLGEPK